VGGEGLNPGAATGEEALLIGEGGSGCIGDLGPSCVCSGGGLEGNDGPDKGDCCLREGDGECNEPEPAAEESVDDLNGCTGFMLGLRLDNGDAAGDEPSEGLPPTLAALSFRRREISSLAEPTDLRDDDPSEIPDPAAESKPEVWYGRRGGKATVRLPGLRLVPTAGKGALGLEGGGKTNRSATETDGGDRGNDVRRGRLFGGEVVRESRC
jgi:hypothetical protein